MNTTTRGWLHGLLGVLIFSGSLPATRVAVTAFEPVFLTGIRAVIAAALAALLHEPVTWPMLATALGVIACVAGARRFAR